MARWKLVRHTNTNDVYSFTEGEEITVGRGVNNAITLPSIVVSRNHCVIKFQEDHAIITDLKVYNIIIHCFKTLYSMTVSKAYDRLK